MEVRVGSSWEKKVSYTQVVRLGLSLFLPLLLTEFGAKKIRLKLCKNMLLLLFSIIMVVSGDQVLWHSGNCDVEDASVTDAVCCHDSHCEDISGRNECKADITCHWKGGKCRINRDATNNVCCKGKVHKYCEDIVRGVCPDDFQV